MNGRHILVLCRKRLGLLLGYSALICWAIGHVAHKCNGCVFFGLFAHIV